MQKTTKNRNTLSINDPLYLFGGPYYGQNWMVWVKLPVVSAVCIYLLYILYLPIVPFSYLLCIPLSIPVDGCAHGTPLSSFQGNCYIYVDFWYLLWFTTLSYRTSGYIRLIIIIMVQSTRKMNRSDDDDGYHSTKTCQKYNIYTRSYFLLNQILV